MEFFSGNLVLPANKLIYSTDVSKIETNTGEFTLQFTVIMNLPQNAAYAHGSEYVIFTCL